PRLPVAPRPWGVSALLGGGAIAVTVVILLVLFARGREPTDGEALSPSATAAASAPAEPSREVAIEVEGLDANAWRTRLRATLETRDYHDGATAVLALGQLDPSAFRDPAVREAAVAVAAGLAFEGNGATDRVFRLFTDGLGPDGLDVLFDIVRTRGGTKGAKLALDILRRPEVLGRAPPALRISLDLRTV